MSDLLRYEPGPFHDAVLDASGAVRPEYRGVVAHLEKIGVPGLDELRGTAELSLMNQGITFTVYADEQGTERIFPFDLIPRLITAKTWAHVERGVKQRITALNRFLADLYGEQQIVREGIIPADLVVKSSYFCRAMAGIRPPGDVYVHVAGVDLIQDEQGTFRVLEDNLRVPSGVSYVLENRAVMGRVVPELVQRYDLRDVDGYPRMLLEALSSLSEAARPNVAVLTPGVHNSAYFEHSFLASQMGVQLVEGQDLLVSDDTLYMRTTAGLEKVDVLYRRVDDDFLDPLAFRPDSALGVTGLMHAARAGTVALANAPGTGVADDKAMYAYVPAVIRYYLSEEPILEQIPTYLCRDERDRAYVLDRIDELVVKPTEGSGGYGLLVGPHATPQERDECRRGILKNPEAFIAQPVQALSTCPTLVSDPDLSLRPRHVDLRPFAVCGADGEVHVLPGGLTRVALRKGSLVVNSSQGGGSKDTWVLASDRADA